MTCRKFGYQFYKSIYCDNINTTGIGHVPSIPNSRKYILFIKYKNVVHAFGFVNFIEFSCQRPTESLTSKLNTS